MLAAHSAAQFVAERPTYDIGDTWDRSDGSYELKRIEDDEYVFVRDPLRSIYLTKDLAISRIVDNGVVALLIDPPTTATWPLTVGKVGATAVIWRRAGRRSNTIIDQRLLWMVERYEDVTTAAGRFKAFKITHTVRSIGNPGRIDYTLWYAPEIRRFVKGTGSEPALTFELAR